MHAPYNSPYAKRKRKLASARGRRMAEARWKAERQSRNALAALPPEQNPSPILRRIIVINHETSAKEAVIYASDSLRSARRKLRDVLSP